MKKNDIEEYFITAFYFIAAVVMIIFAFMVFFNKEANAQQTYCADHKTIVNTLKQRAGEEIQSIGINSAGALVETFANLKTGTFTIVATMPNKITCIITNGDEYYQYIDKLHQQVL